MLRLIASLGLSFCLLASAHSEELIWSVLPLVGVAELEDGKPAEGVVNDTQQLLERALPELEHRYVASAPKRLVLEMQSGVARCSTFLLRHPELDRVGYFVPYLPTTPIQLVARAQDKFPISNGAVSLQALLQIPTLRGGISEIRGYPTDLQPLLNQGVARQRIKIINSSSSGTNLLSMISHGRLDYSFEYSFVLKRYVEMNSLPSPLVTIPIAENTQLTPAGLYCTKSPWGKAMAIRLDQAIRQIVTKPEELLPIYRVTVGDQATDYFEAELRTYLESRAKTPTSF